MGKTIILTFITSILFSMTYLPPKHSGKCGVIAIKAYTQNLLGKNVGYYVEFKNSSKKSVDAIEWTAKFYNNFDELKGSSKGEWSSGNIISPIESGETTRDLEGVWVNGATKVFVTITRVHFTDGTICK
jgi:hypothetical protein